MFQPLYWPMSGCALSYYKANYSVYNVFVFVDEISFTSIKFAFKIITVAVELKISVNLILQMQYRGNTTHHNSFTLNKEFKILIAKTNHIYHTLQCEKNDTSCVLHVTDLKTVMTGKTCHQKL
jgi:hypothetical protein